MNKLNVLIIDDDKLQANMLKSTISSIGDFNVQCVYSGNEAMNLINKNQFDLIFCDLQMPEMDGVEFLSNLDKDKFSGGVVIVSSLGSTLISIVDDLCNAFNFSFVESLEKPINVNQINNILEQVKIQINNGNENISMRGISISDDEILSLLKSGKFINYYQPQVDFNSGQIVSMEVLARLEHPIYGILAPFYFLSQLESNGLLDDLFNVVIDNAIRDFLLGKIKGKVSINITQDTIGKVGFANQFISKCKSNDVDPNIFILELNEGDAYNTTSSFLENISRLRIHNVGISIDDFGTGYSSLEKLSRLPFTEMKLDKSFISYCLSDEYKKVVIKFALALSKELNIPIVAEGVENKETWQYLKNIGFDICQGYFTGKPSRLN
ncbi:EAL domain-containing protein [Aliivibrio fischeri]|uniref:EAL domain-containing response regulator n=1 Tax=Aliivibrio fischeri TaxID=668 RepID=UPI0012DA6C8A|nr:EAL domain-containing response regulator [Aliivibrio fischeri]MUJ36725.1 EAL domain-containing protein [Aliivibrio fischeri]